MPARKKKPDDVAAFKAWVTRNGGQVLVPTNPYEQVRFLAAGQTCVIYCDKSGRRSSYQGFGCEAAWSAFRQGQGVRLQPPTKRSEKPSIVKRTLLQRDGNSCFYCTAEFSDDLPATIEHLISVTHGGPDHIANKFLACRTCNTDAGHLSAVEKIKLREKRHGFRRLELAHVPFFLEKAA